MAIGWRLALRVCSPLSSTVAVTENLHCRSSSSVGSTSSSTGSSDAASFSASESAIGAKYLIEPIALRNDVHNVMTCGLSAADCGYTKNDSPNLFAWGHVFKGSPAPFDRPSRFPPQCETTMRTTQTRSVYFAHEATLDSSTMTSGIGKRQTPVTNLPLL